MNKSILIRGSIIMGLFLLVIGAAVGCSLITADGTEPMISNGDDTYLEIGDYTVTNQQLWDVMKNVDGLNYLLDYVDRIILEDYINDVTQDEVDKEILILTYLTDSEDIIAEIRENTDLNQDYIDAFNQNLIILGFDPENPDDLRTFVEVGIAKANLTRDYILVADEDDVYYLDMEDVEEYYDSITYGDTCVVELRFESAEQARLVFEEFDLVPDFNYGIGRYVGTIDDPLTLDIDESQIDIEDVTEFILIDDEDSEVDGNTEQMDDDEIFEMYIMLYNYMNPWEDSLPVGLDLDDAEEGLCIANSDQVSYNYEEMVKDRSGSDLYVGLAAYFFDTLVVDPDYDENEIRYAYSPQTIGDNVVYAFKVSQEETVAFADLDDDEVLAAKNELLDIIIYEDVINNVVNLVNEDVDFEIYDPYLALKYHFETGISYNNDGSKTIIAIVGDLEITADDLFAYMEERVGVFYSIELAKMDMLLNSDAYFDIYGDDYDYMNSNSAAMVDNRDELREMKTTFANNGFANYGFSSATYSWEEFIYLAFSVKTESEVIEQIYIVQDIQTTIVYPTINYSNISDYIESQYNDYFSLNITHLLLYVDFDKDFTPDDFEDYKDGLAPLELIEFEGLRSDFDNLITTKLNDGDVFSDIVNEYQDSLVDDVDNVWAPFKEYGFLIMTENLSTNGSLTHNNSDAFDDNFELALKDLYDRYVVAKEQSIETMTEYLYPELTETAFGYHILLATEGTAFEQPSAKYDPLDDPDLVYSDGSENENDIPTEAQVLLYNEILFSTYGGPFSQELLPSNVSSALDSYYRSMFEAYFSQTGFSIVSLNFMFDNDVEFATNNAEKIISLESILEVLYIINFNDGFVVED